MNAANPNEPTEGQYHFKLAIGGVEFQNHSTDDPVPTGRQILAKVGVNPKDDWSLFAILPSGDFEDIRLDETFDLRAKGAEEFIAFQTDRDFKLTLNGSQLEWGKPTISGRELGKLAKLKDGEAVFIDVRGGEDRLVEEKELVCLAEPGIEHFIVASKPKPGYEITVNGRPRVVDEEYVSYEQVTKIAFPSESSQLDYSVSYGHAASTPHSGELSKGHSVKVKKQGTTFNVTPTNKS